MHTYSGSAGAICQRAPAQSICAGHEQGCEGQEACDECGAQPRKSERNEGRQIGKQQQSFKRPHARPRACLKCARVDAPHNATTIPATIAKITDITNGS